MGNTGGKNKSDARGKAEDKAVVYLRTPLGSLDIKIAHKCFEHGRVHAREDKARSSRVRHLFQSQSDFHLVNGTPTVSQLETRMRSFARRRRHGERYRTVQHDFRWILDARIISRHGFIHFQLMANNSRCLRRADRGRSVPLSRSRPHVQTRTTEHITRDEM